ncbi:MAG: GtrA family protein [Eubacteriales bacterium]|nr:GtrA family protein [Eubacteriales bacterium]
MRQLGQILKAKTEVRKEFIRYLISGLTVTLVNLLCFSLLTRILGLNRWYFSNLPAILLSIIVAYILNRCYVFRSKKPWKSEFWQFLLTRSAVSFTFEYLSLWLLLDVLKFRANLTFFNLPWAKLLAQIAVVIGNYLLGKFFVFKDRG